MAETTTITADDMDERPVEEVRCTYTGVPIPSIPAWYAGVKVKFFSEASRKSGASPVSFAELEAGRVRSNDSEDEEENSDLDADLDLEDVELDMDEDTEDSETE